MTDRRRHARTVLERLRALNPTPATELVYHTPFQLLISVMLSARTTDKVVNESMRAAYAAGFDPDRVLELGEKGILNLIRRIGLAPTKAKRVVEVAALIKAGGGKIPSDRPALEALPGVGRKTANVILAELYGEPTLAVDTHVYRVGKRLGWHDEPTPERAETVLMSVIDRSLLPAAHHWLILHGRYTCKSQNPACSRCPVADLCPAAAQSETKATAGAPSGKRAAARRKRRPSPGRR